MITTSCCMLLATMAWQGTQSTAAAPAATMMAGASSAVSAIRAAQPLAVDGVLDEPVWRTASPISEFMQRDPDEGKPASQRSIVRVAYDDEALYIGAELLDAAPDSIIARLARRDRHIESDRFLVFVDSYHDRRTGFYFGVNAAGTLYDGTLYNDDWDDDTWDGVWEAVSQRSERGWVVEMRIPYSQLRFQQSDRHVWGINFKREIARRNEQSYLTYTPKNGSGFVSRFRELRGLDGVTPPARLEILPYVTAKAEYLDVPGGNPFNDGSRYRPSMGFDLKYGLGSNLTLDATVNPDFGQVEVDPAVVNLSDGETFFEEKRPFFIEGANTFSSFGSGGANNFWGFNNPSPDFIYTRRIGRAPQGSADVPDAGYSDTPIGTHILGAGKLSGKVGGWNVGALNAVTKREHADVAGPTGDRWTQELEPLTYYGAARTVREFADGRQGLGFVGTATARSFADDALRSQLNSSGFALGVDGWTFIDADKTWVLTAWSGLSHVRGDPERITALQRNPIHYFQRPDADHIEVDPNATSLSGWGGRVTLNKQKGNWYSNTAVAAVSPGFEVNDLGFQWTSDVINAHQLVGYRWRTPTSVYREATWNATYVRSFDFDGNAIHNMIWSNASMQFRNYWGVYGGANYLPDRISNRRTRGGPLMINPSGYGAWLGVDSDSRRSVYYGVYGEITRSRRDVVVNDHVSGYVTWKPIDRMSLTLGPSLSRDRTSAQYVSTVEADTVLPAVSANTFGNAYVFASIDQTTVSADVRVNWIFTPKLSFELYAQPFFSSVDYHDYKQLAAPRTYDFAPREVADTRDFNVASLRGNAVLRWEYLPGSTLFVVWTQNRSSEEEVGDFRMGRSFNRLFDPGAQADNIFLVKLSYWWNP